MYVLFSSRRREARIWSYLVLSSFAKQLGKIKRLVTLFISNYAPMGCGTFGGVGSDRGCFLFRVLLQDIQIIYQTNYVKTRPEVYLYRRLRVMSASAEK